MIRELKRCTISYLPPPFRTPPKRVLPPWENAPINMIIERHPPYFILIQCDRENALGGSPSN